MTLLVTGAAGFVGLNVIEAALLRGQTVLAHDRITLPSAAAAYFATLPGTLDIAQGDITDTAGLHALFERHRISRVVHLAAITPNAERERTAPGMIVRVNVAAALDLLTIAHTHGVNNVLLTSSVAAYGAVAEGGAPIAETRPLAPLTLYAISKLALELGAARLAELSGAHYAVARLGPVYGRWEWATGVRDTLTALTHAAAMAARGEAVVLPRAGHVDWIYATDVAEGILAILDAPDTRSQTFNVGSGKVFPVSDWCSRLMEDHSGFTWQLAGPTHPANVTVNPPTDRPPLDISKIASVTGWRPRFDVTAAYADYAAFIRQFGSPFTGFSN